MAKIVEMVDRPLRRLSKIAATLTLCLGLASCAAVELENRALSQTTEAAHGDWNTHGGTYLEQRFSSLDQINASNVGGLRLAWYFDLDTNRGQEATPLVIDGVLYTTTAWSKVKAINAATGSLIWEYDPQVAGAEGYYACCDVVNRGAAYADGRVFFGTIDGRLIALDAASGALVWSTQTTDPDAPYTITGAPRVAKGKVFIGNGGGEYGVRGYVSAYDIATGEMAWRFYTVPGNPANGPDGAASDPVLANLAAPTWHGQNWVEYGGGGTVWDAIVYDPEYDQLYIGVGNGSPWNHRIRSEGTGDNLFLSSIVALDPDTGEYLWHFQETPGESWDFTATQPIILASLPVGGRNRDVILHAPKNGFFYVIDRQNGAFVSAENFVPVNWADGVDPVSGRPNVTEAARALDGSLTTPGGLGAHNWYPMSFSPQTGLVYLPAQEVPFGYLHDPEARHQADRWNVGVVWAEAFPPDTPEVRQAAREASKGYLVAWDPVAQREVWRFDHGEPGNGGTLATAGGLVFQGNARGIFRAFDARSGSVLWEFDAQDGMLGGPIAFEVAGKQYVAVLSGMGGAFALGTALVDRQRAPNGRVLVFSLDGNAALPELAPNRRPIRLVDGTWSEDTIARGRLNYLEYCMVCHGEGVAGSGVVPDLRRSPVIADARAWRMIVHDGILETRGMVGFGRFLDHAQIEEIRGYVVSRANADAAVTPR